MSDNESLADDLRAWIKRSYEQGERKKLSGPYLGAVFDVESILAKWEKTATSSVVHEVECPVVWTACRCDEIRARKRKP